MQPQHAMTAASKSEIVRGYQEIFCDTCFQPLSFKSHSESASQGSNLPGAANTILRKSFVKSLNERDVAFVVGPGYILLELHAEGTAIGLLLRLVGLRSNQASIKRTMRSDRSQANLLVVRLLVALHKRERAESRAFLSRPGHERPLTPAPARGPHADSANSAASRLLKNRFSYHNARYNDLAGGTAAGSAGMQPYRGIAWWAYGEDHCICANILPALLPTRIGSVEPHALKTTARRAESTLPENAPSHFTLRRHIWGWRADSCA